MSVQELRKAYEQLPEADQILFAALIGADQLSRQGEFSAELARRHRTMDQGRKWTHDDVLRLHEEMAKQGL